MQNNILDNNKIVNLTPLTSKKSVSNTTVPTELRSVKDHALASKVVVIKKDGTREDYNFQKIVDAVKKSAGRVMISLSDEDFSDLAEYVESELANLNSKEVNIAQMHDIVESALEDVSPKIARSYRNYRNYKKDFVHMLDKVYQESQKIMYIGDKENSNADSALVSTKRSLIFNELNKELYKKFFLNVEELQAINDGYIYIHDMSARRDTMNCCLFDVASVLKGGFEMGNLWYNEPKSLNVAFDVIGDITMAAASQQYGGFTLPEVDKILAPYAQKTYNESYAKYIDMGISPEQAEIQATKDVEKDFHDGFQGWEYKFNTVASSRGDYPFITVSAGLGQSKFEKMATIIMLNVRRDGQGNPPVFRPFRDAPGKLPATPCPRGRLLRRSPSRKPACSVPRPAAFERFRGS